MSNEERRAERPVRIQEGYRPMKKVTPDYKSIVGDIDQKGYQPDAAGSPIENIIFPVGGSVVTPPQATTQSSIPLAAQEQATPEKSENSSPPSSPAGD